MNLKQRHDDLDLTPVVTQARRGLRRDVKALAEALPKGQLFLPLAKRLDHVPLEQQTTLGTGSEICAHTLVHPETQAVADVVFTHAELMTRFQDEFGWRTDDGPLEYAAMPAHTLLELALRNLEAGHSACLLINPFHESMLELQADEIRALVKNEPIPLKQYVKGLPVQEGEHFVVGAPAAKPPQELGKTGGVTSRAGLRNADAP